MLDGLSAVSSVVLAALAVVFALWTFFICKLVFLGKPRNVNLHAFGVRITVTAPNQCRQCNGPSDEQSAF